MTLKGYNNINDSLFKFSDCGIGLSGLNGYKLMVQVRGCISEFGF